MKDEIKENDYEIEFIDPEDLVGFIQDEDLKSSSSASDTKTGYSNENELEEPELKYTDKLVESSNDYIKKRREDTRGRLALAYTILTFLIFFVIIAAGIVDGIIRQVSIVQNLSTLLPLVSGIFLGTLGFVLGYYFKKDSNR